MITFSCFGLAAVALGVWRYVAPRPDPASAERSLDSTGDAAAHLSRPEARATTNADGPGADGAAGYSGESSNAARGSDATDVDEPDSQGSAKTDRRVPPSDQNSNKKETEPTAPRDQAPAEQVPAGPSAETLKFLVTLRKDAVRASYLAIRDGAWGVFGNGMRGLPGQDTGVQMSMKSMVARLIGAHRDVDPMVLAFFWAQVPNPSVDQVLYGQFQDRLRKWYQDKLANPAGTPEQDLNSLELQAYALLSIAQEQAALRRIRKMDKELCEHLRDSYAQGELMVEEFRRPGDQEYRLKEAVAMFEKEYLLDVKPANPGKLPLPVSAEIDDYVRILDRGARLDDPSAARALRKACEMGKPLTVRYLLHRGVDPNARIRVSTSSRDYDPGSTALFEVVKWRGPLNRMITQDLIRFGAQGRVETNFGETPMSVALHRKIRAPEVLRMIEESCAGDLPPLVYHGWSGAVEIRRSGFPWHEHLVSNTVYNAVLEPEKGKGAKKRRLRFVLDWEWQTRLAHGILRWNDTGTVTAIRASVNKKNHLSIAEIGLVARRKASRRRYPLESWAMQERENGPGLAFRCAEYAKWQRIELKPSRNGKTRGGLPHTPKTWVSESSEAVPAIRKDGHYAAVEDRVVTYVRFSTGGQVLTTTRRLLDDMEFESTAREDVAWVFAGGQEKLKNKTAWARSRGDRLSYAIYKKRSLLSLNTANPIAWVFGEVHANGDLALREIDLRDGSVEKRRYRFVPLSQER